MATNLLQYPAASVSVLAGVSLAALTLGLPVVGTQLVASSGAVASPSGFNWPQGTYPITFSRSGSTLSTNFNPATYAAAALGGTKYFVNVATGSDANTGLSSGQSLKSIHAAITKGNTAAVPFWIEVNCATSGSFPRENGFTNTGTLVPATQPCAVVAINGRAECWTGSVLTWPGSPDATFPNTYKVVRGSVARVINLTTNDANGDYAELVKVADATACNATANSWAQVAGDLYVHRTAEAAPTTANTRVLLLSTPNLQTGTTSKDIYVSGVDFQGGNGGAVSVAAVATLNAMFVNCSMKYAGAVGVSANGLAVDNITGLVAAQGCIAACNEADGFNAHQTVGAPYFLTISCIGRNNGRDSVLSCNGWTAHEGVIGIDLNGIYFGNYGANVIPIGTTQTFCLGTYAHDSVGDVGHGGTTVPTDFQTQNTATMWLEYTRSGISTNSLVASNTSAIKTHGVTSSAGQTQVVASGASISMF